MTRDILNLSNLGSVVRQILDNVDLVCLGDFTSQQKTSIPSDYMLREINLEEGDLDEIEDRVNSCMVDIQGCSHYQENNYHSIFTALYEAVRNAFQHGNNRDPTKKIVVGYKVSKRYIDLMVEDQGGVLDPRFLSFILAHRSKESVASYQNFYDFSGAEKPDDNSGVGTNLIHVYMDRTKYYHSVNGGLIIHMRKKMS